MKKYICFLTSMWRGFVIINFMFWILKTIYGKHLLDFYNSVFEFALIFTIFTSSELVSKTAWCFWALLVTPEKKPIVPLQARKVLNFSILRRANSPHQYILKLIRSKCSDRIRLQQGNVTIGYKSVVIRKGKPAIEIKHIFTLITSFSWNLWEPWEI